MHKCHSVYFAEFFPKLYLQNDWIATFPLSVCVGEALPLESSENRGARVLPRAHCLQGTTCASRHAIRARGTRSDTSCLSSGSRPETGERNRERGTGKTRGYEGREIGHGGTISGEKWSIVARRGNNADWSDTYGFDWRMKNGPRNRPDSRKKIQRTANERTNERRHLHISAFRCRARDSDSLFCDYYFWKVEKCEWCFRYFVNSGKISSDNLFPVSNGVFYFRRYCYCQTSN